MKNSVSYVYIATPYSHPDKQVEVQRYESCMQILATLHALKMPCYSPIVHWHNVSRKFYLPGDADFWRIQDHAMIFHAKELWVIKLEGWEKSVGVESEIEFAQTMNLRVVKLDHDIDKIITAAKSYRTRDF